MSLVFQACPDLTTEQYGDSDDTRPAIVSATVNDLQTGSGVTITGSLSSVSMNSPDLTVLLQISEATYNLLVSGVLFTCTYAGGGYSWTAPYTVVGRQINGQPLPADKSHLTGSIEMPMQGSPGITQKISWDLKANF